MRKNLIQTFFRERGENQPYPKLKFFLALLMLVAVAFQSGGILLADEPQQISVSGTVSDAQGQPLAGVTVMVKNTTTGTLTDGAGKYSLPNIPSNATLAFSFIGLEPQEVAVNGQTTVNVTLRETTMALEEVVVIGYGTQKKESVVGAISQTTNEQLKKTGNVTDFKQAITGQLPGVITLTASGEPGGTGRGYSSTNIFIRGMNTWNGGQPLILVDGVERGMDNIDVNEVENISVLKDASATAVFGVKGANGVIHTMQPESLFQNSR
jgi:TonB-dependent SusC/RagA subfamily outer membrane receptor